MPHYDIVAEMYRATVEDRRRILESGSRPVSGRAFLAPYFAARDAQLRWLRESLERDLCPPWLIRMVVEQWMYVPEREWV